MDLQKLLSKMTLKEKLAEITQATIELIKGDEKSLQTGPLAKYALTEEEKISCGSVLSVSGAERVIALQKEHLEKNPHGIPMLFMADIIHGYKTIYPIPLAMGATFEPNLLKECTYMSAKEASVAGIHVTFNPMVDMVRDARWGRVMETTGEDPYLNCLMTKASVEGFQGDFGEYNIAACVKHFACYGGAESGRDYNLVEMSEYTMRDYYLPAYKVAVDAGAEMVMTSFNTLNGIPATASKMLLTDLLRDEWGFEGVVITDYAATAELVYHGVAKDEKQASEMAINAGVDVEMVSLCYLRQLEDLVKENKVSIEQIDRAVLRILKLKQKLGLFENPYRVASKEKEEQLILCKEHRDLARVACEKACVLLKNDGVLPFSEKIKKIAVIGPFASVGMIGFWSYEGDPKQAVTLLDGLKSVTDSEIVYTKGFIGEVNEKVNAEELQKAVDLAKSADAVIICAGEFSEMSGEGNSKSILELPEAQINTIKAVSSVNKNTAVVLYNGRPLALENVIDDIPALVTAWQPGTEGGNGIANLLFGKVNFQGKLPMSFPRVTGQVPIYYNRPTTARPKMDDNESVPYTSRYIDCKNAPLFPFGYGLSYSKFEISDLKISSEKLYRGEKITVSAKVKNNSTVAGVETVQLYIRDLVGSIVRPEKQLKGFIKVELNCFEEKEVAFEIDEDMLKYYTANKKFEAESGEFYAYISNDSSDKNKVSFSLED